ncbi:MAG: alpha/beta hydrolase [Vicinamibacterales bacterium]
MMELPPVGRKATLTRDLLRPVLLTTVFLILSAPATAQPCPPLQVRNAAGNYIVAGVKGDIPYSGNLALDAYVQQGSTRPPSIIVIHGGGWTSGSRIAHVGQLLEFLTGAGYNWFSLDYHLGGIERYEESLGDIRAATAFIRCRAADFGIDPNELILLGEDSGAHLAALLARERLPGVVGAALIGGYYDLNSIPRSLRSISRDVSSGASPLTRPAAISTLVIHGAEDNESPPEQAQRYCDGVDRAGGRCRFVAIAGASHRSENWWPTQWHYKQALAEWLGSVAGPPAAPGRPLAGTIQKDIQYRSSGLALDAYLPRGGAPRPAVIVVHGGGWEAGDKVTYITPIFEPLARAGLAWFSIDYRLTPQFTHEDQMQDLREAVRFVRAEHTRFNIDPARIFLLGESASGQMVSLLAAEDRSLAGVVSFYGVYDFTTMVTDASPRSLLVRLFRRTELNDEARDELRRYSPLHRAHKDMPPLLLVNGTGERLWAQAQAFDRTLSELGVSHDVVALEGAPHGMENWEGHPEWTFYKERVVGWIRQLAGRQH